LELSDAVRRRRMVRAFTTKPLLPGTVAALVDLARRAPSAGHTQGWAFVALEGPEETARYWDVTLPEERRIRFRWPGLLAAPALLLALVRPDAWPERYAEADKVASGLGVGSDAWSIPYWWIDGGMAVEHVLLGAVDAGLGACFFGLFGHEAAVLAELGVPDGWRALGTIAIGHPAPDEPGRSTSRGRRPLPDVLHQGGW
jgi:nitroreductase